MDDSSGQNLSGEWVYNEAKGIFILTFDDGGMVLLNQTLFGGENFQEELIQQSMRQYLELKETTLILQ